MPCEAVSTHQVAARWRRAATLAALLSGLSGLPVAHAQVAAPAPAPAARLAADIREEHQSLPVTVTDAYGRRESLAIALTLFRPPGDGPFPLAVVAHGRSSAKRAELRRARFEQLARYLVAKGFAVMVPTRAGYGESADLFDPEASGPCNAKRYEPMARAAADQLLAVVDHARSLPWVDGSRWVLLGQSVGGLATLAVASRAPQGLAAAVNFSGGAGGDAVGRVGDPCSPQALSRLWRAQAGTARVPVLWLYWSHDRYWGEQWPRDWAKAWRDGGGQADFHQLSPWGSEPADGHDGLARDMDRWAPLVEAHLAAAGFTRPGLVPRPAASGFARLDEPDRVPLRTPNARQQALERFNAARKPRALAIGPGGHYGWASGDWALGRALGFCGAASGQPCRLYAVDDDVVWVP